MTPIQISFVALTVLSALTGAAACAVWLRTRRQQALKYVTLLSFLNTIGFFTLAALFIIILALPTGSTAKAFISIILVVLAFLAFLSGWTSIMFYLFGVLNGVHEVLEVPVVVSVKAGAIIKEDTTFSGGAGVAPVQAPAPPVEPPPAPPAAQ